jgi:predicted DsbA family dithiol-disulfide isomerase
MESWVVGFDGDSDVERHSGAVETATEDDQTLGAENDPLLSVRLVSDYICPWCWIGLKRVERLMDEFAIEFDVCAYELRPGLPLEGLPREQVYANRVYPPGYVDNLLQTAREAGIDMQRPPLIPNTRKAHEATEFAKQAGRLLPFHRAVFRAYWESEQNIGDVEVLSRIGAECGLDTAALREAMGDGRYVAEVEEQIAWTRVAGITGVPTFIFDEKFALVGAQEYEVFRDLARRIVDRRVAAES